MVLSIVILTHNSASLIENCIDSVKQACLSIKYEIIIIDNNSHDATIDILCRKYPEVHLITNQTNEGIASARNKGIITSKGEYILILDDDITVHKDAILLLLEEIQRDTSIGILAPQLLNPDGTIQSNGLELPSVREKISRFIKKLLHITLSHKYIEAIESKSSYYPGYVIGAAQIFSRTTVNQIGLLDDHIFYGPEDADFCIRVKHMGLKVKCYPLASMTHAYQRRSYDIKQIPMLIKHIKGLFYFWKKHKHLIFE